MYEHRTKKLLSREAFAKRITHHIKFALSIVAVVLGIGMAGYHLLAHIG